MQQLSLNIPEPVQTIVVLKKYANRKLYNTHTKGYVGLKDIESYLKSGSSVRVIDNVTKNDITAKVLVQLIYERVSGTVTSLDTMRLSEEVRGLL